VWFASDVAGLWRVFGRGEKKMGLEAPHPARKKERGEDTDLKTGQWHGRGIEEGP